MKTKLLQLVTLVLVTLQISYALSRQTEAAMRDFSKLRLEVKQPLKFQDSNNYYRYKTQGTSATEDVGVGFKPSFPVKGPSMDFISFNPSEAASTNHNARRPMGPPESMRERNENDGERNSEENVYQEPGMGGFYSHRNPNYSQDRPLIGGPSLEEDISSIGLGISPAGYSTLDNPMDEFNLSYAGLQGRKPEMSYNPDDDDDEAYRPQPQQQEAEEGYGFPEGVGSERGSGGLFDGDSNDADSDNEEESSYGNFGRRRQHGPGQENPDDETGDDPRQQGYRRDPPGRGGRPTTNNFDYGDY